MSARQADTPTRARAHPDPVLDLIGEEARIARRIEEQGGARILVGLMDSNQAREAIRQGIRDRELDQAVLGRNPETGKPETYAEAFERLYSEPLRPKNHVQHRRG